MVMRYKLLEHPFYQQWSRGEITRSQLSAYAHSYYEFVRLMPVFWEQALNGLGADAKESSDVINDEKSHTLLWENFRSKFEPCGHPGMNDLNEAFLSMNASRLLGAVHAFETQQPEVARTKSEGLLKHYGFGADETGYFDAHLNEAEHIKFGITIAEKYADRNEFEAGFAEGSRLVYDALDRFLA